MLVEDARGEYGRGILQSRSHNCLVGSHECLLMFTPSCCSECFWLYACTEMFWMYGLYVSFGSLCRYCCIYFLAALVLVCVDVMVMSSA